MNGNEAEVMKWVFTELAAKQFNTEQIWKSAKQKGLTCSKANFWLAIRNPLYCGKIFVPKYKDEESRFVQGQHEALISEALFYDVQDILNGRKKVQRTKIFVDENLPLRGFLLCPQCGRLLTGSNSKGCRQKYHYYHCTSKCGSRFNAKNLNEQMVKEIKRLVQPLPKLQLYKEVIISIFNTETSIQHKEEIQLKFQLKEIDQRLIKARDLLLNGDIEVNDYRTIKTESEDKMRRLEVKFVAYSKGNTNIEPLLNQAATSISNLDLLYTNGSVIRKRKIISSIFPEKLIFDGFQYRTTRINEAINIFSLINKQLSSKKNETNQNAFDLSRKVTPQRLELWTH